MIETIPRYSQKEIVKIWSDENKLRLWQETEFAVLKARADLDQISQEVYEVINDTLTHCRIDIDQWKLLEQELRHDLNAFVEERRRFLPFELRPYLHEGITSYDTEDPAFVRMLKESADLVIT